MSVIKIPYVGQNAILEAMITNIETFYYHLYQNDHVPAGPDTTSSYTEATFSSYTGIETSSWSTASTNRSNESESDSGELTWNWSFGGGGGGPYGSAKDRIRAGVGMGASVVLDENTVSGKVGGRVGTGGSGNTIYGYYVTDLSLNILWAERFDSPVNMMASGDQIAIETPFILRTIF